MTAEAFIFDGDDGDATNLSQDAGRMVNVRGRDVLAAIFDGCAGLLELRALPSKARAFVDPGDTAAIEAFAVTHRGENVYFGVSTRRDGSSGELANCAELGAVFVDVDCHGVDQLGDAEARLAAFLFPPSIVLRSGGGLHGYWLLKEPAGLDTDAARVRTVLRQIAVALGGDLAAAECARILRLPGSFNHKYLPAVPVSTQTFVPDRRVNLSDFDVLPSEPATVTTSPTDVLDLSTIAAGERNTKLYRLGRTLRAKLLPATAIAEALRATNATCRPPLDTSELEQLIAHVTTQADRSDFVPDVEIDATVPGLELTTIADLLAEPDETVDYLVDDRIAFGSVNLLAGKPKAGKSTAARVLSFEVARGGVFLGSRCLPRPVWYLALEEKRSEVRKHFRQMGATGDEPVRFLFRQPTTNLLGQLHALAATEHPGLVIVDTLQRLIRAKDLNDYAEVTNKLTPVLALARETGAALLLVHHASKTERGGLDDVLGSTALTGSVDNVFVLARTDRYRVLKSIQRIGPDLADTVIMLDATTGQVAAGASRHDADVAAVQAALLDALAMPLSRADLLEAVEARRQLKLEALRRAVDSGTIRRTGAGTKADPYRFTRVLDSDSGSQVPSNSREPESSPSAFVESANGSGRDCGSQVPAGLPWSREPQSAEPADDLPACLAELVEPDFSDPIGAHDADDLLSIPCT